ncbi:MAG: histidine phosphatase family protein [Rhodocyclaceae bacterium]|nr:histidine phosphatase family protein [Rhodocyclaceae bacterium]
MDLILWRHAEAEDPQPGQPDAKRRLTPRGQKQARKMARWLRDHLPHGGKGCRILVSPAHRTQETASALQLPFEIEPRLAIGRNVEDHLIASGWPDNHSSPILLIGHQPVLGSLCSYLLTGIEVSWPVRKGSIWWFSLRDREGSRQVLLKAVLGSEYL